MRRVMIVGQPGAGKSWLARALGRRTGLPVIHLDRIQWQPGWQPRGRQDRDHRMLEAARDPEWIIEGNYRGTWRTRLARADTLVVLDLPLWLRAWRVFRRTVAGYGRPRPDSGEGCAERFDPAFWKWIWDTRHVGRAQIRELCDLAGPDTEVHLLRGPRDVARFVATLDRAGPAPHPVEAAPSL
ncbi:isopentenyl transferase family protein [Roseivivax isoporae]|uniref:DNA topology modulation protein FlaR n=1 Tax=Roseivivax isoporae LMG 25204 TaxID=1449351 RepID=X7FC63_9RHOB|nr:isopentenyl transferase family protein [Roseivivax isoporae]ETX29624.1 DNA topology modulation protein FlaR [Roseivivax isoporae LMG 25204]